MPIRLLLATLLGWPMTAGAQQPAAPIKPAGLKPGDMIRIVAPAGELVQERIELAAERLREKGFRVSYADDLFRSRGYLAGSDERRAEELMDAFTDPGVDAVFPGTGGYGTMRILDRLDYDAIRANAKILIGFSDITGLHLALGKKCGLVTFHSPNPQWGLGSEDNLPAFSAKSFWRCLLASENATAAAGFTYETPASEPLETLAGGVGAGPMCGGNLSLVAAMVGSDYEIDTTGQVLFLEDVNEAPYRIDRMLRQLKLAGQLNRPAAVVLGRFRKCDADADDPSLSLQQVFLDYFADAPYPVVSNFPAGHVTHNATLPFGVPIRVDADRREVRLLENPVTVAGGE